MKKEIRHVRPDPRSPGSWGRRSRSRTTRASPRSARRSASRTASRSSRPAQGDQNAGMVATAGHRPGSFFQSGRLRPAAPRPGLIPVGGQVRASSLEAAVDTRSARRPPPSRRQRLERHDPALRHHGFRLRRQIDLGVDQRLGGSLVEREDWRRRGSRNRCSPWRGSRRPGNGRIGGSARGLAPGERSCLSVSRASASFSAIACWVFICISRKRISPCLSRIFIRQE